MWLNDDENRILECVSDFDLMLYVMAWQIECLDRLLSAVTQEVYEVAA